MGKLGNQDGTWLTMAGLLAVGLLGSRRGGSRSRDARKQSQQGSRSEALATYLERELGPSMDGRSLGDWRVAWEYPGSVMVWKPGFPWSIWATPGWQGEIDGLGVQLSSDDGEEDHFVEIETVRRWIGGTERLWTGDLATDAEVWERLLRPVLAALDAGVTPQELAAEP